MGNKLVCIRSNDGAAPTDGAARADYVLTDTITTHPGTRLLASVTQLTFPRVPLITNENRALSFVDTRGVTTQFALPLGAHVTSAAALIALVRSSLLRTHASDLDAWDVTYDAATSRVSISHVRPFLISGGGGLLGFGGEASSTFATAHTAASSVQLARTRAFYVRTNLHCATETSGKSMSGVLCRVPVTGTSELNVEHWAPLVPHTCLLVERHISALTIELLDCDTFEAVSFGPYATAGWAITIAFTHVHTPARPTPAAVSAELMYGAENVSPHQKSPPPNGPSSSGASRDPRAEARLARDERRTEARVEGGERRGHRDGHSQSGAGGAARGGRRRGKRRGGPAARRDR